MMTQNLSLLQWLATFHLDNKPSVELKEDAYYNLADGYVCARVLNQISSPYFTDKWLDGIKPVPPNGSWRLRVSNLKRILQKIHDYASDLQSSQFKPSAITPDVAVIAQNFDPDQICRLIKLIIFCAINCDKKEDYIAKIRELPTQVKQDIKEAIEELLIENNDKRAGNFMYSENETSVTQRNNTSSSSQNTILSPVRSSPFRGRRDSSQSDSHRRGESHLDTSTQSYYSDPNESIDEVRQKLQLALAIKDEKAQACHDLESRLKQLQLERDQLAYENEKLFKEKLSPTKTSESRRTSRASLSGPDDNDPDKRSKNLSDDKSQDLVFQQNKRLQSEVQRLKEEIIRTETEKEDYRLKSNLLKDDLDRLALRYEEIRNKADQAKRLQDELDEHKHISEKLISYETMIENLVKKNNDLKRDMKNIEEKNLAHIQNIVRLEEENNQLNNTISQVEVYKKQLNEAQVKLSQETHRADQAEVELLRLSERFSATKKENERLFETTNQLIQKGVSNKDKTNEDFNQGRLLESVNLKDIPPQQVGKTEDGDYFGGQQADVLNSMTMPAIELKERIARLEIENGLLLTKLNSKTETNKSVLNGLLESANDRCKKLEVENRQFKKKVMLLESNLKDLMTSNNSGGGPSTSNAAMMSQMSSSDNVLGLIKRVEELQRLLYQREQDLLDAETKYKKNIQKAKDVIKALNNNHSISGSLHPSCVSSASSFNSSSLDETNLLRQQLRERGERLIELQREFYEFKKFKEVHERLILSAFYGMTTPRQWKNAEKRLERTTLTSPPNTANSSINIHSKHSH